METNTGINDKLPVIKYRDYAKKQMEEKQWQTLKQKNRKYRK